MVAVQSQRAVGHYPRQILHSTNTCAFAPASTLKLRHALPAGHPKNSLLMLTPAMASSPLNDTQAPADVSFLTCHVLGEVRHLFRLLDSRHGPQLPMPIVSNVMGTCWLTPAVL